MRRESNIRVWLVSASLSAALGGCYNPDLAAARFRCDPSRGDADCPSGQRCVAGLCQVPDGKAPPDLSDPPPPPEDLSAPPPPPDSSAPPPDLAMKPDMTTPPCAGSDYLIIKANAVYGCRGAFKPPGGPAGLCGPGYHVCKNSDSAVLKTLGPDCDQPVGFFAADVNASLKMMMMNLTLRCNTADMDSLPILLGCGRPHDGVTSGDCSGLTSYIICNRPGAFVCTSGLANTTYDGQSNGGVLCCRN